MRSKLSLLSSALLFLGITGANAQGVLKEGFNTDEFPSVSFVWHEDNPEKFSTSDFKSLTEAGLLCDFTVDHLPVKVDADMNSYVVFLWEDLSYHGANLFEFSKESLRGFIENCKLGSNDKISVSVYGRREVSDNSYLNDLTGGFVSDGNAVLAAVDGYTRTTKRISNYPNRADIFPAVSEALEILHKAGDGAKAVIVLTAGYPLDNSSASSDMNARLLAEKYHIPVHFLQYGRDHGYSAKLSSFAPLTYGTFGCYADMDQKINIDNAQADLLSIYKALPKASLGNDYKVTYKSNTRRGGEAVLLEFKVNGFDYKFQMVPPARSIAAFVKEHPIITGVVLFLLFGLLALVIVLYVRRRVKEQRKFDALSLENKQNREAAMSAISEAKDSFDRRFDQADEDKRREEAAALAEELAEQFKKRSVYPRLVYQVDGETSSYVISEIETTIGRESANDVVLNDSSVSRRHAKIIFNGCDFAVVDQGSMNGVAVNGVKITGPAVIKDGDKLSLGGVLLTVYL